jgi:hypothetical protein
MKKKASFYQTGPLLLLFSLIQDWRQPDLGLCDTRHGRQERQWISLSILVHFYVV